MALFSKTVALNCPKFTEYIFNLRSHNKNMPIQIY